MIFNISLGTRTDKALKYVRHKIFTDNREGVPKIAVLITDGASWYPDLTANEARLLKKHNVTIMVVAISNKVAIITEKAHATFNSLLF